MLLTVNVFSLKNGFSEFQVAGVEGIVSADNLPLLGRKPGHSDFVIPVGFELQALRIYIHLKEISLYIREKEMK